VFEFYVFYMFLSILSILFTILYLRKINLLIILHYNFVITKLYEQIVLHDIAKLALIYWRAFPVLHHARALTYWLLHIEGGNACHAAEVIALILYSIILCS